MAGWKSLGVRRCELGWWGWVKEKRVWTHGVSRCVSLRGGGWEAVDGRWEMGMGRVEVCGRSAVVSNLSTGTQTMMRMTFSYIYSTATQRLWDQRMVGCQRKRSLD